MNDGIERTVATPQPAHRFIVKSRLNGAMVASFFAERCEKLDGNYFFYVGDAIIGSVNGSHASVGGGCGTLDRTPEQRKEIIESLPAEMIDAFITQCSSDAVLEARYGAKD